MDTEIGAEIELGTESDSYNHNHNYHSRRRVLMEPPAERNLSVTARRSPGDIGLRMSVVCFWMVSDTRESGQQVIEVGGRHTELSLVCKTGSAFHISWTSVWYSPT